MKTRYNLLIVAMAICFGLFLKSCSEDTISPILKGKMTGKVVKAKDFSPIENVKITLSPGNNTTFTNEKGLFVFEEIEAKDYSVNATKDGYLKNIQSATVKKDDEVNVIFEMNVETALNKAPEIPTLLNPKNNEEVQELEVELKWTTTDPDKDTIYYSIEVKSNINNDILVIEDLTDTVYKLTNLKYGAKYFWQVSATDRINEKVLSPIANFTVRATPENRYFYVEKGKNGNNCIYSSSLDEEGPTNLVKLTSSEQNSWRPRKNNIVGLIAFLQTTDNQIHLFTMHTDGSHKKQVSSRVAVEGADPNEIDFSWAPNGESLIYPHFDKLYQINRDGSGLTLLYKTTDGSFITECQWNSEKTQIALKTNDSQGYHSSIYIIDLDGNIVKTILSDVKGAVGGLDLTVDNKKLLYCHDISEYENPDNRQLNTHIFLYDLIDDQKVDLSKNKEEGTIDIDPRLSPNDAKIIFVNTSNDGISEKMIYEQDIKELNRSILFHNAQMPDWE